MLMTTRTEEDMKRNNEYRTSQALTPLERALLRLLALGYSLEDAALSVGLSHSDANTALEQLQDRCGVSCLSRLLSLAILKSWV